MYVTLGPYVGRFPAESLAVARPDAAMLTALCYDPSITERNIALSGSRFGRRGARMLSIPVTGQPRSGGDLGQLAGSRALYYSLFDNTIYVIDQLDDADLAHLSDLAFWRVIPSTWTRVATSSLSFRRPCADPPNDRGETEAYWSSKGTGVLHHWSFLYDASFADGKPVHAQYGRLVSLLTRASENLFGPEGPSSFVRAGWAVYCCLGIAYAVLFGFAFREFLGVAAIGLAYQISAFTGVSAFSLLLAPGYHWSREVVMILPAVFLSALSGTKAHRKRPAWVGVALAAAAGALCISLDPSFALVAFGAIVLALGIRYQRVLRSLALRRPLVVVAVAAAVVLGIALVFVMDRSNVGYVAFKAGHFGVGVFSDPSRSAQIVTNFIFAAIALVLAAWASCAATTAYFALISIVVYTYYVITPDAYHYAKYVEYVIPLYVALAFEVLRRIRADSYANTVIGAAACFAAVVIVLETSWASSIIAASPFAYTKVFDSFGSPYFASQTATVNGRVIDADLNDATLARLRSMPAARFDYLLSPLDKYVLFLYDRHNGLESIDGTAWLESEDQGASIRAGIFSHHATVLIDEQVFTVDPLAAIPRTHPVFGSINDQSIINVKGRLLMAEVAEAVAQRCSVRSAAARYWLIAHC